MNLVKKMAPLFVVQFLWIYATPVITRYIFNTTDAESDAFEKGTQWVGICFAFYSLLAALLAFSIPKLLLRMSKYRLHAIALLAGSAGLLSVYFIRSSYGLFISFAFIGIAWSSIGNIPYLIVSETAPPHEMTRYFGVFNFSIVIPQVTAAFLLGYMTKHFFKGETIYTLLSGSVSMFLAGMITLYLSFRQPGATSKSVNQAPLPDNAYP
jgi:maltose/moltooligosaccharide transporter